ncbi:MAG: aminotransferase class I/II-fold pyridoxal phosphate-dependent enzyme [Lachnospiraceae bacterium]|nr:aminotransferase class I/II-fold pyridoxal phosphate-dependent enzyme [Lachnospiraceae bacterium]
MQAIILAAGMGKRLKELTRGNTKCMVQVNGVSLIERALRILDKKGLSRIVIVIGYEGEKLVNYIGGLGICTPIAYVDNPIYNKTNNIYSLSLAKDYLCEENTLLLESDLIFEESVIDALLEDQRESLALVDKFASWMDGTCMELDEEDCIVNFIPGKHLNFADKENYYKTVNIYKLSKEFSTNTYVPFLCAYEKAMGENEYYESVIKLIAMLETKEFRAKRLNGQIWYEIDNIQDLNIAESLFADSVEERLDKVASRYGGFWRYPKLLDFCYLVNPYYPPQKLMEEMKSNFEVLITQYPSGMKVNSLLAANSFGVKQEHIVIGNGAAELIKGLMEKMTGNIGFIYPTFEEYPNRYDDDRKVVFKPTKDAFRYDAADIMSFFDAKDVEAVVLINPDNPSGNYIPVVELHKLITWAKEKEIRLIIDESFVDFCDEGSPEELSLLKEDVLAEYKYLYVVKSISKSYGVPGIRLGVIASLDEEMIAYLKQSVAIWNINSFGEFYMQIMEKYNKDYLKSLYKIKESRKDFVTGLGKISYLKVYPTQANYVMCEVVGRKAKDICCALLKRDILIKDLTSKLSNGKEYIRLAVRTKEENAKLLAVLEEL